jgi:hypothetical protein
MLPKDDKPALVDEYGQRKTINGFFCRETSVAGKPQFYFRYSKNGIRRRLTADTEVKLQEEANRLNLYKRVPKQHSASKRVTREMVVNAAIKTVEAYDKGKGKGKREQSEPQPER